MKNLSDALIFNKETRNAVEKKLPMVALETTIISHGLPYPSNIQLALELEDIIRDANCVPATIALKDGKIRVGLEKEELEYFAESNDILKASKRDIPLILGRKQSGALTVAGTLTCAELAGIKVFATGGIGGVHRNAEHTYDISADIKTLAESSVILVSAGAKAILDLPKTLELFESYNIPVLGYQTDEFPSFYTRSSGLKIERTDSVAEIAEFYKSLTSLKYNNGLLVANPIPEKNELQKEYIDNIILTALEEMRLNSISGKAVTPFLLSYLNENTEEKTITANIELVRNNVRLACKIALELNKNT